MKQELSSKLEGYFYLLIIGLNLIPVLSGKFFPTMDGAAHLYNSNLINSLLGGNTILHDFFSFNTEPVPNWTGHLILSIFNLLLPAYMAEKVLLIIYLIGLPLAFRALIKTISVNAVFVSYFIFPFTYSFVFILGFYNFCIAILFLFVTINYWIKNDETMPGAKKKIILFALIALTYFSHILVFGILMLVLGGYSSLKAAIQIMQNPDAVWRQLISFVKKIITLLSLASVPIILVCYYFFSRHGMEENTYLSTTELIEWIKNVRPIIAFSFTEEEMYTKKLFYLVSVMFIIALYDRINRLIIDKEIPLKEKFLSALKAKLTITDLWLLASMAMLYLYFNMPDADGTASVISVRYGLFFFLFLLLWLSAYPFRKWFGIVSVAIVLFCNFSLNSYYNNVSARLNKIAVECNNASEYIAPNSIVLPLNYSDNWLAGHFSNYLGIDKPMIILENYECATGFFPLIWNENQMPNLILGTLGSGQAECLAWRSNSKNSIEKINYVFVLGDMDNQNDSCTRIVKQNISEHYTLAYSSESCRLYKIK